jgi:hypothetical protein
MTSHLKMSRKERTRLTTERKRNSTTFVGTCSNCRDKQVEVTKFRNAQVCVNKCLVQAMAHLGGAQKVPAGEAIKAD